MAQAKTLTKVELKRLFDVTRSCSRYAERDLTMLQLTHYCGMRVGEVAALRIEDVVDENYRVRTEIVLAASITKSKRARRIFVSRQMHRQLSSTSAHYPQHLHPTHTCLAHRSSHTLQQIQQHSIYSDYMHRQRYQVQPVTVVGGLG